MVIEVNTREHLKAFLNDVSLTVFIESEKTGALLTIKDGILHCREEKVVEADVILKSNETVLEKIFSGFLSLRMAERRNEVVLQSSYRKTLFLDSIFRLAIVHQSSVEEDKQLKFQNN